jgi:hypothetical protein
VTTQYLERIASRNPLPSEEAFELLAFQRKSSEVFVRNWGSNLEVSAVGWLAGYQVLCHWWSPNRRNAGIPEFHVGRKIAPCWLLTVLYETCAGAFPKDELPPEFVVGKREFELKQSTRLIRPAPPTVWADREFLRFCLSYLDKTADWANENYLMRFCMRDGQLRIKGKNGTVHCPARGEWLGISTISARDLFRVLPKRFVNNVVRLCQEQEAMLVDGHRIPARWQKEEWDEGNDAGYMEGLKQK